MKTKNFQIGFWFLLSAFSCLYILLYFFVAFQTITYPFPLEWKEVSALNMIDRILTHQPLYVSPSIEYVPYQYPPVYYYLSSFWAKILGNEFFAPRLVSFLATLGTSFLIYLFIRKESGGKLAAFTGVGFFFGTFHLAEDWFHLAHLESLFFFFILLGLFLVRFNPGTIGSVAAGTFFAAAQFTSQVAFIIILPVLFALFFIHFRQALQVTLVFLVIIGWAFFILMASSEGWYLYYISILFKIGSHHHAMVNFWTQQLFRNCGMAFILSLIALRIFLSQDNKKGLFYLVAGFGIILFSWTLFIKDGAGSYLLIPVFMWMAILVPLALVHLFEFLEQKVPDKNLHFSISVILLVAITIQFCCFIYDPRYSVPRVRNQSGGEELRDYVAGIEGDIFMFPNQPYMQKKGEKRLFGFDQAVRDIMDVDLEQIQPVLDEYQRMIKKKKFAVLLYSRKGIPLDVVHYYAFKTKLFSDDFLFMPVIGDKMRPDYVFTPKLR